MCMFGTVSGSSNTFEQSSNSPFGSPSVFGPSSTPAFWISMPAFGASSSPAFAGASSIPAFGGTSAFGQEPAFGGFGLYFIVPAFYIIPASSTPAFGSSPVPAFGVAGSPFGIGSSPAFCQSASTSVFGSSPSGTATSAFGAPTSLFGGQQNQHLVTKPAFGSTGFGQSSGQRVGSRVTPYAQTSEAASGAGAVAKLESISAMPAYEKRSHEELRWEDYQSGDKGGPNLAGQSSGGMGFVTNNDQQSNFFTYSSAFNQISSNPFSSTTSTKPFAPKTSTFSTPGFTNSAPVFASATSPSLFGTPSTSTFGTTQSSPLFQSSTPTLGQTRSPFKESNFRQAAPAVSGPAFGQSNAFAGNMFSSTPSLNTGSMAFNPTTPSLSMPFQSAQPTPNSGGFGFLAPGGIGQGSTLAQQQSIITTSATSSSTTQAQGSPPFGTSSQPTQNSGGQAKTQASSHPVVGATSTALSDATRTTSAFSFEGQFQQSQHDSKSSIFGQPTSGTSSQPVVGATSTALSDATRTTSAFSFEGQFQQSQHDSKSNIFGQPTSGTSSQPVVDAASTALSDATRTSAFSFEGQFQQSQPDSKSSIFGQPPFVTSSQPVVGVTSTAPSDATSTTTGLFGSPFQQSQPEKSNKFSKCPFGYHDPFKYLQCPFCI